jgi:hypothetical protein
VSTVVFTNQKGGAGKDDPGGAEVIARVKRFFDEEMAKADKTR